MKRDTAISTCRKPGRAVWPLALAAALPLLGAPSLAKADDGAGAPPPAPPVKASPERADRGIVHLRMGVSHNILDQPDDGSGDTILSQSAFTGNGFLVGLTYELPAETVPYVLLETGLFYDLRTATAFEDMGDQRREARIEATSLRIPAWAKTRYRPVPRYGVVVGGGLDLLIGLGSASTVREENIADGEALALPTTSVLAAHLAALAGVEVHFDRFVIALLGHATANPFSGSTTVERFDEYTSPVQRGSFRVEFDYEFMATLGIGFRP